MMKVYRSGINRAVIVPTSKGKKLTIALNTASRMVTIKIFGPRGGMQGTISVELDDFREGLILAGVGKRRDT